MLPQELCSLPNVFNVLGVSMKHVLRRLLKSPLFTAVTLVTLAVGIGANTAIFSVVSGVLLKPLPFPKPDQLVAVWQTAAGFNLKEINASPATYFTYREEGQVFQDIGLWSSGAVSVTGSAEPERADALFVTDGTLPILGVRPALGRSFTRQDDMPRSPQTAMLSYGYWQRRFGGETTVIGLRILVDGRAREVTGLPVHELVALRDSAVSVRPKPGFHRELQLPGRRPVEAWHDGDTGQYRRGPNAPDDAPKVSAGAGRESQDFRRRPAGTERAIAEERRGRRHR